MSLDLARWQFALTTLYHFLFVPVTIGLSLVVAILQTAWVRTRNEVWLRLTHFWGKLFLINFAVGVVTGIVQEFQFGMNWSTYSRYVGDVFGAPLAIEGLLAFFLESTFLGLWIFGWGRLSPRVHLATIWLVAIGTLLSAFFILAANSWMQHPVGYTLNVSSGRAELTDVWALLTNPTLLVTFPHTIVSALLVAGALLLGISVWHLQRGHDVEAFGRTARMGIVLTLVSAVAVGFTGHAQAQVMTDQQPMKMAAAEALWQTETGAGFSLFAVGDVGTQTGKNSFNVTLPDMLSVLATNTWNGQVKGINDLQAEYQAKYGPGDYRPDIALTYWSFRLMVGVAVLMGLLAAAGAWLQYRGRLATARWYGRLALGGIALPLAGGLLGWLFTEMGRQPWVVFGLLRTSDAVSPSVPAWSVGLSLGVFTALYGVLAAVEAGLIARFAAQGTVETKPEEGGIAPPPMAY